MAGPWYDGTPVFLRDRRLVETAPPQRLREELAARSEQPDPEAIFTNVGRVANKAKVLAERIAEQAPPWIDVPAQDSTIRTAVRRKDPSVADGNRITFDLFKDAIESLEGRRNAVKMEDFHDLTGNAVADDIRIKATTNKSVHPDLGDNQLALLTSELMIVWVLNQMMGPWQAQNTGMAVAGKLPPATETPAVISQTIIGIVMQFLIYGLEEEAIKGFLQNTGSYQSAEIDTIISRARTQTPTDMQQLAARRLGEGDYEVILKYALDYIGRTTKSGYEMWLGYFEARRIRNEAMLSWRAAPHYSEKHAIHVNVSSSTEVSGSHVDPAVHAAILDSIVPANVTYLCELRENTTRMDHALNMVGQVLSSHFGQDSLCCVGLFLEHKNVEWVKKVHQLLHIFMMSQRPILQVDFGRLVGNLISIIDDRIRQELVHLINKITHKIGDPVLAEIEGVVDEDWAVLFNCPLVRHLIDMVLSAVDHLAVTLRSLIPDIAMGWDFQYGSAMTDRWAVINSRRKVQTLLASLDVVVAALESGLLCGDDVGNYTPEVVEQFTTGMPDMPHIYLAPEEVTKYFSDSQPIEVGGNAPGTVRDIIPKIGESRISVAPSMDPEREPEANQRCRDLFEMVVKKTEG